MSMNYGDMPVRPTRKRMTTPTPPDAPRCRCHAKAQLYKEGKGFVVACSDPYCPLDELPLADSEACPTESGAWHFWQWKRTGRL
jgi:hypothetical protein